MVFILKKYNCVGVVGHYWTDNFGDVLLRDLMVKYLKQTCNVNKVIKINKEDYQRAGGKIGKLLYLLNFAFKSDFVVFGGGGYLETGSLGYRNTSSLFSFFLLAILIKLSFKKFCIAGVGVGPNVDGLSGLFIKMICLLSSDITIRDNESKRLLESLNIKKTINVEADAAIVVANDYQNDKPNSTIIALHLLLRGNEFDSLKESLIDLIHNLPAHYDLHIISDHGPIGAEKELLTLCTRKITLLECKSSKQFIDFLATCHMVVTTKLHVGIVTYALGRGIYNIYRHPKCLRFYEQINWLNNSVAIGNYNKSNNSDILTLVEGFGTTIFYDDKARDKIIEASENVYNKVQQLIK